jgi:hypothetical protein
LTREPLFYLRDIVDSIEKIKRYCAGLSFEEFTSNDMIIDAVIRNLEVIGEAAARLPHSIYSAYPDVPWKEMRGRPRILPGSFLFHRAPSSQRGREVIATNKILMIIFCGLTYFIVCNFSPIVSDH